MPCDIYQHTPMFRQAVLLVLACVLAPLCARGVASPSTVALSKRITSHWRELLSICPYRNYTSCSTADRTKWTDASKVTVSNVQLAPLGEFSTLQLVTYDETGAHQIKGGDSWFISVREIRQRLRLSARVFDEGNGTYTVAVVLPRPGNYTMFGILYYSACNGLQTPWTDNVDVWQATLKKPDHCFVGSRFMRKAALVHDGLGQQLPACALVTTTTACREQQGAWQQRMTHTPGWGIAVRTEVYTFRENGTFRTHPCCKPYIPPPAPVVPLPTNIAAASASTRSSTQITSNLTYFGTVDAVDKAAAALAAQPVQVPKPWKPKRVLTYGDSTSKNAWELLSIVAHKPCKPAFRPRLNFEAVMPEFCVPARDVTDAEPQIDTVLRRCNGGLPMSTIPIGADTKDIQQYVPSALLFNMANFTYNDTRARNHSPAVPLPVPHEFSLVFVDGWGGRPIFTVKNSLKWVQPDDVLVFNVGLHYVRSYSFEAWQKFVDELGAFLADIKSRTGAMIAMRTSYTTREHVFRAYKHADGYVSPAHFQTEARRLLFDSYAESVFLPLGIHVWDVFGICLLSDYVPNDMVHTDGLSSWTQNLDMFDLFACKA